MSLEFLVYKCKRLLYRYSFKTRLVIVFLFSCMFTILYRYIASFTRAQIIPLQEIPHHLVPAIDLSNLNSENERLCDIMPILINGSWPLSAFNVSDVYLKNLAIQTNVQVGGSWKPSSCVSQHKTAIVIPYRDRESQLNTFLAHIHPFLQFQHINYQIFVIEQSEQRPFNRAKLFNIGFKEAEQISQFHCFIFHDVDLIPINIHNVYGCTKLPRHLSANIDIFNYKVPYDWIFGGAISILKTQFMSVNGFSNKFFGWGGEDDDFYNRVTRNGTTICRFEPDISKYIMLSHKKEIPNEDRYYFLVTGERRFQADGLNSLKYSVRSTKFMTLYTRILVDL